MKVRLLDIAALALAFVTVLASVWASTVTRPDPGIHLAYQDGQVVIGSIDYASMAADGFLGLQVGEVVVTLDDQDVLSYSENGKQSLTETPWIWLWMTVTTREQLPELLQERAAGQSNPQGSYSVFFGRLSRQGDLVPIGLGLAILLLGWWWLGSGRGGPAVRRYALTLPVATAVPLLVLPLNRLPTLAALVVGSILVAAAMLPLALDLAGSVDGRRRRIAAGSIAVGLAAAAAVAGVLVPLDNVWPSGYIHSLLRAGLIASIPFVPGVVAAMPLNWRAAAPPDGSAHVFATPEVVLAFLTPGVAAISLLPLTQYLWWPILFWLAIVVGWQLRRPLAVRAIRATHQRDLVAAATEAERARIAADIHDDALQDLTMLVRRLDAAGDKVNADAAREVAEHLRVICGDLRLPVLDDLGVGPALEWLCGRLDQSTGPIALDRLADENRFPAEVELSVFRVAQEALSNAVQHGSPPIVVRYRTRADWVELEVDDSGPGIAAGAAEQAELTGHLGLLTMAQRAEAVGGNLKIGRRPGGGTRVSLIWERGARPVIAPANAPANSPA
ncbi:MAG TPA: ATP-binding protein [Candidatus Limnocylindrales bacterium]